MKKQKIYLVSNFLNLRIERFSDRISIFRYLKLPEKVQRKISKKIIFLVIKKKMNKNVIKNRRIRRKKFIFTWRCE